MNTAATTYVIRVDGHLDDHWSAWLGEVDMACHDDGTTTLTVQVADQAQLHGVPATPPTDPPTLSPGLRNRRLGRDGPTYAVPPTTQKSR